MQSITILLDTVKKNKDLLIYYYGDVIRRKCDGKDVERTSKTIDYLRDCGFSTIEILAELSRHTEDAVTGNNLKDILWKNSLIKKGAFYLHNELTIISPEPVYDFKTDTVRKYKYFYETKIRYTIDNVLKYFYSKISATSRQFIEKYKDAGAVKKMMELYKNIDYIEPLDIILCSIDRYIKKYGDCCSIIEIKSEAVSVAKELEAYMQELDSKNLREITWR